MATDESRRVDAPSWEERDEMDAQADEVSDEYEALRWEAFAHQQDEER